MPITHNNSSNDVILQNLFNRYCNEECCATCKRLGIFTTDTGRKYFTCRKKKNMYELHFLDIKCEDWKPSGFDD
jgi:hypothetical protein